MSDLQKELRSLQRLIEFNHLEKRLNSAQLQDLESTIVWMLEAPKRRWWMIAVPDPQPPTPLRALWLWLQVIGAFLILSTASVEAVVASSVHGIVPYGLIVPIYLALAMPIAAIAIANLIAQMHVPAWRRVRT